MKIKSNITKPPFNPIRLSIEIESLEELVSLYARSALAGNQIKNNYIDKDYAVKIKDIDFSDCDELYKELKSYLKVYLSK